VRRGGAGAASFGVHRPDLPPYANGRDRFMKSGKGVRLRAMTEERNVERATGIELD
jgi:hypothetical protein